MTPAKFGVRLLSIADADPQAIGQTLAQAFSDDPVTRWTFPPQLENRERYLLEFFTLTTSNLLQRGGLVAASGEYNGLVTWLPHSATDVSAEVAARQNDQLSEAAGACAERVSTLMNLLEGHHPAGLAPHSAVVAAGIRPANRHSGLQMSLIGTFRDYLVSERVGVYAEASSDLSLRLWKRWGLRRVGHTIALPAGPRLHPIYADADQLLRFKSATG